MLQTGMELLRIWVYLNVFECTWVYLSVSKLKWPYNKKDYILYDKEYILQSLKRY